MKVVLKYLSYIGSALVSIFLLLVFFGWMFDIWEFISYLFTE